MQKYTIWIYMAEMLEVSNLEFKASVINTLRVLMEKVDSKQG